MRFAAAGVAALALLAPGIASAQGGGAGMAPADRCPGDVPSIRMGVENLLKVRSRQYASERAALGVANAGADELRLLRGGSDRPACRRLLARVPRRYRAMRDGHRRYDIVLYRVRDRYLVAIQAARAGGRRLVPRLPDRILSYDLEFEQVGGRVWP